MVTRSLKFFVQVWEELGKVTWPTRNEAIRMTITVVVVSSLVAAFIGGLDLLLTAFVSKLLAQ